MRSPLLLMLAATAFAADPAVQPGADRTTIPLDAGWHFHRGDMEDALPAVAITTWRWREGGADEHLLARRDGWDGIAEFAFGLDSFLPMCPLPPSAPSVSTPSP